MGIRALERYQSQADLQGLIDPPDSADVQFAPVFDEAALVDGSDLIQENRRVVPETAFWGENANLGGVVLGAHGCCDRSDDDHRAVLIGNIVLDDHNRSGFPLLRAEDGIQPSEPDVATPAIRQLPLLRLSRSVLALLAQRERMLH